MYGEALTLRAQFYTEAIRNWGDLPANFAPASTLAMAMIFTMPIKLSSLMVIRLTQTCWILWLTVGK